MKIAFMGDGAVATSIAALAKAAGHSAVLGVRNPDRSSAGSFVRTDFAQAIADADIVIVAVPHTAAGEVLLPLADALACKVVVDATNAVAADWSPILTGEESSGAEHLQTLLPKSRLVKAFNTVFADTMRADRLVRDGSGITLFVASDDPAASNIVMTFGAELGFAPVNAGPLKTSRYLEAIAHLNIELAIAQGGGTDAAILYHRATPAL
ncbi:NADPH-dependent F420 reductase [Croceibacterium ferulae]|uniref:NADPH-dependent F420 reductase n=1 Tax=Croceibacterium ferulae TaxID=1854641 RepID=UPI000EADDF6D|nr:NAD(P)-binding domain-containing protein [Croceibacterium ferulae]